MSASPISILIIEDEPDVRIYLINLLQRHGYEVVAVSEGKEGLALARRTHPALVVLDTMLSGEDAQKVYMKLRSEEALSHIPVILLSPLSRRAVRGSGFYGGRAFHKHIYEPDAFLTKPPEAEDFLSIVQQLTTDLKFPCHKEEL